MITEQNQITEQQQQQQQQQLILLSQASRGRLDMKPKVTTNIKTRRRSHGSGTLMANCMARR
jgi:hypothetical protein